MNTDKHKYLIFLNLCLSVFICGYFSVYAQDVPKVTITSMDKAGKVLRTGPGFFYDDSTIVCGYATVKDAAKVQVQSEGSKIITNRILTYSDLLDIAILKSDEEIESEPMISFVRPSMGDPVYFLVKQGNSWRIESTAIFDFKDTGKGFNIIQLRVVKLAVFYPSPLFNRDHKIIGWMDHPDSALPLEQIARFVDRDTSVSLSELDLMKNFWPFRKMAIHASSHAQPVLSEMTTVYGNAPFSFQVDFPKHWKYKNVTSQGRLLMRAADEEFGMSVEMRVMPANSDDLMMEIGRVETLIFPGMSRSDLSPYSADHFTGLKATYEDPDPDDDYFLTAFLSMSKQNFYILSVSYPGRFSEEAQALMDQVVSSFHPNN